MPVGLLRSSQIKEMDDKLTMTLISFMNLDDNLGAARRMETQARI